MTLIPALNLVLFTIIVRQDKDVTNSKDKIAALKLGDDSKKQ